MISRKSSLIAILCCLVSIPIGLAQESRGTIVGRITDPTGSTIPAAAVEVTNKAQGTKQTLTSNDSGLYQASYLIPGVYEVAVTATGFKRTVREVNVAVGDRLAVDIQMPVGDSTQTIDVTAEAPLLETASASTGQVVDTKRI